MITKLLGSIISLDAILSMVWFRRWNNRKTYKLEQAGRLVRLLIGIALILL